MVAGGFVLVVLSLLWWIIQRGLVRPASHLTGMSERVLPGNIQVVARDAGSGDLSIVAAALNHVRKGLRGYKEKEAHARLAISEGGFGALVEDLQLAMDMHKIPFRAQNKLLAVPAPMHCEVITRP